MVKHLNQPKNVAKRVSNCKFCLLDLEPWQFCYCNDECRRLYYLAPAKRARRVSKTTGQRAKYNGIITEYMRIAAGSKEMSILTGKKHTDISDVVRIQHRGAF